MCRRQVSPISSRVEAGLGNTSGKAFSLLAKEELNDLRMQVLHGVIGLYLYAPSIVKRKAIQP